MIDEDEKERPSIDPKKLKRIRAIFDGKLKLPKSPGFMFEPNGEHSKAVRKFRKEWEGDS